MIKAVIFDWSGVLSDDWEATVQTSNDVLEAHGHPRLDRETFRELYELPWMNFYKKLDVKIDMEEEYRLWEKFFPKYYNLLKPFEQAKTVLEQLKEKNVKTMIFSAHNEQLLLEEIENYGFSGLIGSVKASIPDKRDEIEALVSKHEIDRDSTIYVGDMCHDVETARLAGIKSVAVLSGYDSREKLEKENPDYIIEHVGELPALMEQMEAEENARVATNS
ncbi:MAG: hypothetical protein CL943_02295 [Candidatus Diapherotrites archaeon]|uniref:HAD family hydrolase n=1 Tax=Candidatus Iainarchaeum sp. TaxID=3101447 RepID=A0A2D6M116_9ARCH|nr:hypothetical protein [Candidatus Diapherotrites archaeon]|tara:strand:- start:1417 stop:2076 length:660 start_codon:yes stop_codon:yes gene_type:complete